MKKLLLAGAAIAALATSAQAADLGMPRGPVAAAVIAPVFNWTGFYLGAHIGYGFGRTTWTDGLSQGVNANGVFGGIQAGYNYQFNNLVVGLEADIAAAGINGFEGNAFGIAGFQLRDRTTMLASVRARAGVAVDRALIYATGGLGIGTNNHSAFLAGVGAGTSNATQAGWTLGAGIEYAFAPNWTAKAEYLYYNFGTRALGNGLTGTVRTDIHTVKLGVNYLFSTGPSAVVARY